MAIQPDISLAVRVPQVENPLDQAGKALSIVGMRQQQQLGQQNLVARQLANQEAVLKQQDDQAISQAWTKANGDPDLHVKLAAQSGARPQAIQALQQHYGALVQQKAVTAKDTSEAAKNRAAAQEAQNKQIAGTVDELLNTPDDQYPTAYAAAAANLKTAYPDLNIPPVAPPKETLNHIAIGYRTDEMLDKKAAELRAAEEEKRKAALAPSALEQSRNLSRKTGAEADVAQLKSDAMKKAVDAYENRVPGAPHPIDAVIPPTLDPIANQSYKETYDIAMKTLGPDGAMKVAETAAQHAAQIGTALNPAIQKQKVNEAVAIENATAPGKTAQAIATAKALRMGDNPAVRGVPPGAVAQVQNDAIKLDQAATKAKASSEGLGQVLTLAESGNKAAGSNVPLMNVQTLNALNGIKRINGLELTANKTVGNLWDEVMGKVGKITEGQPIPKNVLEDMRKLQQALSDTTYKEYTENLNALNARTGAKFSPVVSQPNMGGSTPKTFPADKVKAYGMAHGITDEAEAKKAIEALGYTVVK